MGLTNSLSVLKRTRNILMMLLFVHIGTLLNRGSTMAAAYNFFKLLWFPLVFALQMSGEEFFNFFFFKINAILMFHNRHWVIIYLFTNKFPPLPTLEFPWPGITRQVLFYLHFHFGKLALCFVPSLWDTV